MERGRAQKEKVLGTEFVWRKVIFKLPLQLGHFPKEMPRLGVKMCIKA